MSRRERNDRERMERDSAASLSAAESPDAVRKVAIGILRRQGYLMAVLSSVIQEDLCRRDMDVEAEYFRNRVHPMVDELLNFSFKENDDETLS